MNGILAVFVLMLEASTSCRDDQLLTGQWDVSENISNHQYEIEFSKPDIVELRFRGNVDVGNYEQKCNETYASLKLSWPNGSDTLAWLQYGENGEIRTYQRFSQAAKPEFNNSSWLSTLDPKILLPCADSRKLAIEQPALCLSEGRSAVTYKGISILVPDGWHYGSGENGIIIQPKSTRAFGVIRVQWPGPKYSENRDRYETLGLRCIEIWHALSYCTGAIKDSREGRYFNPHRNGIAFVELSYPMQHQNMLEPAFARILASMNFDAKHVMSDKEKCQVRILEARNSKADQCLANCMRTGIGHNVGGGCAHKCGGQGTGVWNRDYEFPNGFLQCR